MATAKITLIGLYNYDSTLFEGLQLPEYFDKDTLVNTILLAGGEFGCIYSGAAFMKQAITLWSAKNQRYFERLAVLMQTQYDPLENYNRRESWQDHGTSSNDIDSHTTASYNNTTNGSDTNTTENKVSAYNSSEYENRDRSTSTGSDTETDTGTSYGTGDQTSKGEFDTTRAGYARGNIGVTTSQEMFRQEMGIVSLSPYDVIAGDFINEFCIKLYV